MYIDCCLLPWSNLINYHSKSQKWILSHFVLDQNVFYIYIYIKENISSLSSLISVNPWTYVQRDHENPTKLLMENYLQSWVNLQTTDISMSTFPSSACLATIFDNSCNLSIKYVSIISIFRITSNKLIVITYIFREQYPLMLIAKYPEKNN